MSAHQQPILRHPGYRDLRVRLLLWLATQASYARPGKLFTANHELLQGQVGMLKGEPFGKLIEAVVELLRSGTAEG